MKVLNFLYKFAYCWYLGIYEHPHSEDMTIENSYLCFPQKRVLPIGHRFRISPESTNYTTAMGTCPLFSTFQKKISTSLFCIF